MLQGRLFSYGDTQRYRLGVNFNHIPVNAPQCPFQSYHRDGKMRTDGYLGRTPSFNPNSAGLWDNQPDFAEPPLALEGEAAHWDHRVDDDHWERRRHHRSNRSIRLWPRAEVAKKSLRQTLGEKRLANSGINSTGTAR
jgi:catalase